MKLSRKIFFFTEKVLHKTILEDDVGIQRDKLASQSRYVSIVAVSSERWDDFPTQIVHTSP